MKLSTRMVALALCLVAVVAATGILLVASFHDSLASELGRGLDAYGMYAAAFQASVEAFAGMQSQQAYDRAVRISLRFISNAPMVAIMDSAGAVLYDSFPDQNLLSLVSERSGQYVVRAMNGRQYQLIRGNAQAAGSEFVLSYAWDVSRVYQTARAQARNAVLLILFMCAVLAILLYVSVRWSFAPMRRLGAAAERLSGGAYDARAPVVHPHDEVGALAATFNAMADSIESHVAALKKRDEAQK